MTEELTAQMQRELSAREILDWGEFLKSKVVQRYFEYLDRAILINTNALKFPQNDRDKDQFLKGKIVGLETSKSITKLLTKIYKKRGSQNGPDKTQGVE